MCSLFNSFEIKLLMCFNCTVPPLKRFVFILNIRGRELRTWVMFLKQEHFFSMANNTMPCRERKTAGKLHKTARQDFFFLFAFKEWHPLHSFGFLRESVKPAFLNSKSIVIPKHDLSKIVCIVFKTSLFPCCVLSYVIQNVRLILKVPPRLCKSTPVLKSNEP